MILLRFVIFHDQWKKLNSTADIEMTAHFPETPPHTLKEMDT